MKRTFIILRLGISGGTGTLSIRLGESLIKEGFEVLYICQEINDLNNYNSMINKGIKVYCWELNNIYINLKNLYDDERKFDFLTYSLDEFLYVEILKESIKINKSTLYIVHHYGLIKGSKQNFIIKKLIKFFYSKLIKMIINSDNVIFMDNISIEETEKYYGIKINKKQNSIFNLPMEVQEFDKTRIDYKLNSDTFNILTIARADFPFKGYIIGLIDDFGRICNLYNNITLTIITFGKDEYKVARKIKELAPDIQNKISLEGQTPYEKLNKYFDQTHLYIGMGTTLLDAVNNCIPALAVQQYTYNSYSSGYFHMNPDVLVGKPDIDNSINMYINEVKQMNNDEYRLLCEKEHDALLKFYNSDKLVKFLSEDDFLNNQKIIEKTILYIHKTLKRILEITKNIGLKNKI